MGVFLWCLVAEECDMDLGGWPERAAEGLGGDAEEARAVGAAGRRGGQRGAGDVVGPLGASRSKGRRPACLSKVDLAPCAMSFTGLGHLLPTSFKACRGSRAPPVKRLPPTSP